MILTWLAPQAGAQYSESEVKAAFILNFAQFSKWPAKAFAESGTPLTIGIFGDDSLGGALDKVCRERYLVRFQRTFPTSRIDDYSVAYCLTIGLEFAESYWHRRILHVSVSRLIHPVDQVPGLLELN